MANNQTEIKVKVSGDWPDLEAIFDEAMAEVVTRIRYRTPVRTGALQRGWGLNKINNIYEITNEESYATYVESGTDKRAGVHMVRISIEELQQILQQKLDKFK